MLYDIEQIIHKVSGRLPNRKTKHVPKAPAKQLYQNGKEDIGEREKGKKKMRKRIFKSFIF